MRVIFNLSTLVAVLWVFESSNIALDVNNETR